MNKPYSENTLIEQPAIRLFKDGLANARVVTVRVLAVVRSS